MILNEILQDSYPYRWEKRGKIAVAFFTSIDKKLFEVDFVKGETISKTGRTIEKTIVAFYALTKNGDPSTALTNDRDHLMILSTVLKIIKDYVAEHNISILRFSAKEPARAKIYEFIARRFANLYNFSIEKLNGYYGMDFNLIKNNNSDKES